MVRARSRCVVSSFVIVCQRRSAQVLAKDISRRIGSRPWVVHGPRFPVDHQLQRVGPTLVGRARENEHEGGGFSHESQSTVFRVDFQ